ncbi:hypothetical protein F5X96DRAFT_617675 [Biscogniauxia mediterranea]|nr:hypothetical protein F5X96DRAFT_617675 [Biscogniauxia mediterranea]
MYVCLHYISTLPYLTLPRNPSTLHFISIYLLMYILHTSLLFFSDQKSFSLFCLSFNSLSYSYYCLFFTMNMN